MKEAVREASVLKRRLLAEAAIVDECLSPATLESPEEFAGVLNDLVAHYRPEGPVEEMLIEQIALYYWRLRRVLWSESAQCAMRVTEAFTKVIQAIEQEGDIKPEVADRYRKGYVQFYSSPAFDKEKLDARNRYEAHINKQLYKSIGMLEKLRAARARAEKKTPRKPRRGASRARPAYLHVVRKKRTTGTQEIKRGRVAAM